MNFKTLHNQNAPVLICNVWDVKSAKIAASLNYQALGTSSSAIASMLGYNDGEEMSFPELEYIVQRMIQNIDLPLTVDLEAGYSRDPNKIATHIKKLSILGVVGVNIEDSLVENGNRKLVDADAFSDLLHKVCLELKTQQVDIFINVRTDAFLLGHENSLQETIMRAKKYHDIGADGLFVPCVVEESDIKSIVQSTKLPLNVMCMPDLPDFEILKNLRVKRISMGAYVFNKLSHQLEHELQNIQFVNSFKTLFA